MNPLVVVAIAGFALTIVINAISVGVAWGWVKSEVRTLREILSAEGDQRFTRASELEAVETRNLDEHKSIREELAVVRSATGFHGEQLASHAAQIAALAKSQD